MDISRVEWKKNHTRKLHYLISVLCLIKSQLAPSTNLLLYPFLCSRTLSRIGINETLVTVSGASSYVPVAGGQVSSRALCANRLEKINDTLSTDCACMCMCVCSEREGRILSHPINILAVHSRATLSRRPLSSRALDHRHRSSVKVSLKRVRQALPREWSNADDGSRARQHFLASLSQILLPGSKDDVISREIVSSRVSSRAWYRDTSRPPCLFRRIFLNYVSDLCTTRIPSANISDSRRSSYSSRC